ncbi:MAG: hypothetical protein MNPFHGCM_01883 [Gemmatimonadaceae bacterium]|nr:hypothetical protein [Gemmatimonadaceae bacterium]
MLDNNFERDGHAEPSRERPNRADSGPLSDREVPLAPVATSDVVNRWLDGELPEPTGLQGDAARSVEFWRRIGEETDRRRQLVTPPHLSSRIMAALPPMDTSTRVSPAIGKTLQMSPLTAIAAAVGIFALGMLVMNALSIR